jgi:hypothetical protein
MAPCGQVLLADECAFKLVFEDFLHLGQVVEPGQQAGAWLGAFQALVEFFADVVGQAGDFTTACVHSLDWLDCCFYFNFLIMNSY